MDFESNEEISLTRQVEASAAEARASTGARSNEVNFIFISIQLKIQFVFRFGRA